jgi:hypothetical protein
MRACLVSGRVTVFEGEGADCERGLDLLVVRAAERVEVLDLDFDLDFVMESSEVMRRHPPHHLSPAQAKPRQGETPKRAFALQSHHSNAPNKPVGQSNLSNIIARLTAITHNAANRSAAAWAMPRGPSAYRRGSISRLRERNSVPLTKNGMDVAIGLASN